MSKVRVTNISLPKRHKYIYIYIYLEYILRIYISYSKKRVVYSLKKKGKLSTCVRRTQKIGLGGCNFSSDPEHTFGVSLLIMLHGLVCAA